MLRKMVLPAALVAAVALGGGAALAAPLEHETAKEISTILHAKVSPIEAVQTADEHGKGRAVEVLTRDETAGTVYEVKELAGDTLSTLRIDATSGKVLEQANAVPLKHLTKAHQAELQALSKAGTTLASAMTAAESGSGGKAIEAAYQKLDGKLVYVVDVETSGKLQKVVIDAETGHELSPMKSSSVLKQDGGETAHKAAAK
jgi:Peptidase propeptide and YPEB domain.